MYDELNEEFGRQLREVRTVSNITQDELAKLARISRASVVNIEQGRQGVSLATLYRLAEALGTSPQELLPTLESGPAVARIAIGPKTRESERAVLAMMRRAAEGESR